MTYSRSYSALDKLDIDNPRQSNWSRLFGFEDGHNKTSQTQRKRKADSPKLEKEPQSTKRNSDIFACYHRVDGDRSVKSALRTEDKGSERNLRFVHTGYPAPHKYFDNNMRQRMSHTLKTILNDSQLPSSIDDLIDEFLRERISERLNASTLLKYVVEELKFLDDNLEFNTTIDRIKKLADDEEEDEYGRVVKPTSYATNEAIGLISKAVRICRNNFSKAWVSTEDNGGIYLTWSKPDLGKELRVLVPANKELKVYLYHEEKESYASENDVTAKDLSKWIDWINS
jgi:hypothetical protein